MTYYRIIGCCLIIPFLLGGCSQRLQMKDALQGGERRLNKNEIRNTLTDATIHISSWDDLYEAEIKLYADGGLRAENDRGEQDKGTWKLTGDNRFCFEFEKWLPDDITCYDVTVKNDSYRLFGTAGGYAFSFNITEQGDPEALQKYRSSTRSRENTPKKGDDTKSWYSFLLPSDDDEAGAVSAPEKSEEGDSPLKAELRHLLEDKECVGCDLRGEDLAGADLDNADLEGAILTGADLSGADLSDSNLSGADLSGADLGKADLGDAVLKNANLSGANLEMALLEEADLESADLSRARLVDAVLDEAVLLKTSLREADLHWASLRGANLKGADLGDAYLVKADFRGADLTGANLDNAVIQRTSFKDTTGYKSPTEQDRRTAAEGKNSGWWFF